LRATKPTFTLFETARAIALPRMPIAEPHEGAGVVKHSPFPPLISSTDANENFHECSAWRIAGYI
jgi:hypothetical protein